MEMHIDILEAAKSKMIERMSAHPFLQRCRAGTVTLDELKVFMVQQGHYSGYFTRYLCAMMANLPSNHEVFELAENLFEELGFAPDSPTPHYLIYRDMLTAFSLSLDQAAPSSGTRQLIDTMFHYCRNLNPAYGLGALCLGAEALVPSLYADLIEGFRQCGVQQKDIEFFRIHVECDDGHAETLRDIMVDLAGDDRSQLDAMIEAGNAMVDARLAFFSALDEVRLEETATLTTA
ncbi:iron-containing redox enzyme family protein [Oxalobacteraceae bacterium]|nr:iron-containing redox enzyme family protein [Oxalobacteraceae bacterium]